MRRLKDINSAIKEAKERDQFCQVCGNPEIDGAHYLPRNVPYPRYSPFDPDNIIGLCRWHHSHRGNQDCYDANSKVNNKIAWFVKNNLRSHAARLLWITDNTIKTVDDAIDIIVQRW